MEVEDTFTYEDWAKTTAPSYTMTEAQFAELEALYAPVAKFLEDNKIPGNFAYVAEQHPTGNNVLRGKTTAIGVDYYTTEMMAMFLLANGGLANFDAHYEALLDAHNKRILKNAPRIVTNY